jgi:hypothetical protein
MKSSHLVTPRTLSECQFTVGSSDPIVEPAQWIGKTYTTHFDHQRMITNLVYGVSAILLLIVVVGSIVSRFF